MNRPAPSSAPGVSFRRFDLAALAGYWKLEALLLARAWGPVVSSSVIQPLIYLLAFSLGFGGLPEDFAGRHYIEFLGTGMVAVTIMFSTTYAVMYRTFVRREIQRSFDAMLAAPIDVHEIVAAQALWTGSQGGLLGLSPLAVSFFFGLQPRPGMLIVIPIGVFAGIGFTLLGLAISVAVRNIDSINYIVAILLTPAFLAGGTFFPLDNLPAWLATIVTANPIYQCTELVRHITFGIESLVDLAHFGILALFTGVMFAVSVWGMRKRLID